MAEGIIEVGDGNFEAEVLKSDLPILVDFWAPWCGPCRAIAPTVEQLAKDYSGKIRFAKCNVDDNPTTPRSFEIKAIPTLIVFKDGKIQDKVTGMTAKSKLEDVLNKLV
jgi:thioredoxin 1